MFSDKQNSMKQSLPISQRPHSILYFHLPPGLPFLYMFNICFWTLQLHICDIISKSCVFLCWISPWRWPEKAKTCKRLAVWLYTFIYNCCAGVGINTVQITGGLQIIKLLLQAVFSTTLSIHCTGSAGSNILLTIPFFSVPKYVPPLRRKAKLHTQVTLCWQED